MFSTCISYLLPITFFFYSFLFYIYKKREDIERSCFLRAAMIPMEVTQHLGKAEPALQGNSWYDDRNYNTFVTYQDSLRL